MFERYLGGTVSAADPRTHGPADPRTNDPLPNDPLPNDLRPGHP